MRFPDSLRTALTAACPDILDTRPDLLKIWIANGKNVARMPVGGFEWRYRINLFFQDWPTSGAAIVSATITEWIGRNQPELLLNHEKGNEAISFEAEILDAEKMDILYEFDLCEPVLITRADAGAMVLVPVDEPPIAGTDSFDGVAGDPLLQGIDFGDGSA